VDERYDSAYPLRLGARVRISLDDGYSETVEVDHPRGSADHPITDEDLAHKFDHLVDPLLGPGRTAEAVEVISRVDQLASMEPLARLFAVQQESERA
jgi:2-methylcitrate dehydratase PrpD